MAQQRVSTQPRASLNISQPGSNRGDLADQANFALDIDIQIGVAAAVRQVKIGFQELNESGQPICKDCGDPIPEKRLRALPNASRCRDCQQKSENSPAAMAAIGFGPRRRAH